MNIWSVVPPLFFLRQAVVYETFIRKSMNLCQSIVGKDANQLYPLSICQPMPTGLHTRNNYDNESQNFTPRLNKTRSFENKVLSYFQQTLPECNIESNVTTGRQKRSIALVLIEFVTIVTLSLKPCVVVSTTVRVKKLARQ